MGHKIQGGVISALAAAAVMLPSFAREKERAEEDIVRLMNAKSLELIEEFGNKYRKTIDATFLHNGTYFICDTAIWDDSHKVINAWGHVQLIQDETVLTSDKMDYFIDEDVAKFRGSLVQLQDKDNNTLRTRYLDYFTKDSTAIFREGSSMRSKDGQIIESVDGDYDSKAGMFTFYNDVNMFTDSIFVRTQEMKYDTGANRALFTTYIDFWKDDNMLSSASGWYDRPSELFFFTENVHATSPNQELWCDSLYFYRETDNIEMFGSVQVQDQSRDIAALCNHMFYEDSIATVTMQDQAAVAMMTQSSEDAPKDTVFIGADSVRYNAVKVCDIPQSLFNEGEARLKSMMQDAVSEYRAKVAKEAEEAARKAKEEYDRQNGVTAPGEGGTEGEDAAAPGSNAEMAAPPLPRPSSNDVAAPEPALPKMPADSLSASRLPASDSLAVAPVDSLAAADSLAAPAPDTSKLGFLLAVGDVKVYRSDMQVSCDSLLYSDIDSVARLYIEPVVWNETNRQYSSDSIFVLVRNNSMERADLQSNAFIITYEADNCFDQIKANEVMAYFDSTTALRRFDALGGAQALFYLEENDAMATVNKVESRMLTATFVQGDLDRVFYFENPKNDAIPAAQLRQSERQLKGFLWQPERRPLSRYDVTDLEYRESERIIYESRPRSSFPYTDVYFPGYIEGIYREIEVRDSLAKIPAVVDLPEDSPDAGNAEVADSLEFSPKEGTLDAEEAKSEAKAAADTVATADSTSAAVPADSTVTPELSPREKAAAERQARREARWKELDERDAAKAAAKEAKLKERQRRRLANDIARQQRQEAREQRRLKRFIEHYERRKAHEGALKPKDEYASPFAIPEQTD